MRHKTILCCQGPINRLHAYHTLVNTSNMQPNGVTFCPLKAPARSHRVMALVIRPDQAEGLSSDQGMYSHQTYPLPWTPSPETDADQRHIQVLALLILTCNHHIEVPPAKMHTCISTRVYGLSMAQAMAHFVGFPASWLILLYNASTPVTSCFAHVGRMQPMLEPCHHETN